MLTTKLAWVKGRPMKEAIEFVWGGGGGLKAFNYLTTLWEAGLNGTPALSHPNLIGMENTPSREPCM